MDNVLKWLKREAFTVISEPRETERVEIMRQLLLGTPPWCMNNWTMAPQLRKLSHTVTVSLLRQLSDTATKEEGVEKSEYLMCSELWFIKTQEIKMAHALDTKCLQERKWWCFFLSSIVTFITGAASVLIVRAFNSVLRKKVGKTFFIFNRIFLAGRKVWIWRKAGEQ